MIALAAKTLIGNYFCYLDVMSEERKSALNVPGNQGANALLVKSLMDHVSDAIILTNPSDEITAWNLVAKELFGHSATEAIGQPISLIIDRASLLQFRTMSNDSSALIFKHKDGTMLPVSLSFDEIVDNDKNLLVICYFIKDYRENAKQQTLMKEKERAMESFMYSVSHDLRAPLRRIVNYAEILEEDHSASLDEEVRRLVSRMSKNAEKMGELINDLLSFSRVSQHPIKKSTVNVETLVSTVISELKGTGVMANATVTMKSLPIIEADLTLLKRVFENLLSNAVKFTRTINAPVIEVGSKVMPDSIHFYVKDNGVGFESQYASKLFNIFQRLHNPSEYEGSGIGLAIVQLIVSRHGGKVWAEGKLNEGSVFWFSFPN